MRSPSQNNDALFYGGVFPFSRIFCTSAALFGILTKKGLKTGWFSVLFFVCCKKPPCALSKHRAVCCISQKSNSNIQVLLPTFLLRKVGEVKGEKPLSRLASREIPLPHFRRARNLSLPAQKNLSEINFIRRSELVKNKL